MLKVKCVLLCFLSLLFSQVTYAKNIELVCKGEAEVQLTGAYKGTSSPFYKDDIKLEVTFNSQKNIITRAFSSRLDLSLCFIGDSAKKYCQCGVTEDELICRLNHPSLGLSFFAINRKTAVAKIVEERQKYNSPDDKETYTYFKSGNLSCDVFSQNRF